MKEFKDWSPCIYEGAIYCADCPRVFDMDGCDMRAGRELYRTAYEAGGGGRTSLCETCRWWREGNGKVSFKCLNEDVPGVLFPGYNFGCICHEIREVWSNP